nr:neuroblastoma breakpoint family member 19 isoform X2 [Oryctolagus cuniculus]XP_051694998.1 neuroblastoma breakpoint family member 19 isoform X3 [Oryctolagus cuniculus]
MLSMTDPLCTPSKPANSLVSLPSWFNLCHPYPTWLLRELLEVDEMETPPSSQQETSTTGVADHLPSDSCLPEGTVQMSPDAEVTHSVPGVDGEHACSHKKEEPVTVLPENQYHDVEVQEQNVSYTSSRELPEEQEREDPDDPLDECYLTPSISPVVSELDHSTWSSWCFPEHQDVLSAPDADEKENDNDEVQGEAQALSHCSLIREIPEIEDQDVSQDSHELSFVAAPERKTRSPLEGGPHKDAITSMCGSHSISPSDVPSSPKENVIKGKWKPRKWELACRFPGLEMKGKPQPTVSKIAC